MCEPLEPRSKSPPATTVTRDPAIRRCSSAISSRRSWRVPKRALLRPLVATTESGRLKVAKGLRETEAFQRELRAFQKRITEHG